MKSPWIVYCFHTHLSAAYLLPDTLCASPRLDLNPSCLIVRLERDQFISSSELRGVFSYQPSVIIIGSIFYAQNYIRLNCESEANWAREQCPHGVRSWELFSWQGFALTASQRDAFNSTRSIASPFIPTISFLTTPQMNTFLASFSVPCDITVLCCLWIRDILQIPLPAKHLRRASNLYETNLHFALELRTAANTYLLHPKSWIYMYRIVVKNTLSWRCLTSVNRKRCAGIFSSIERMERRLWTDKTDKINQTKLCVANLSFWM